MQGVERGLEIVGWLGLGGERLESDSDGRWGGRGGDAIGKDGKEEE